MDCASCKTAAGREYIFADGKKGLDYVRMDTCCGNYGQAPGLHCRFLECGLPRRMAIPYE